MNNKTYKIKGQILFKGLYSIPLLEPDHVSLGKCATCQQFQRRYASTNDTQVIEVLHEGYEYIGFKKIFIESLEEEGFANMHHVLCIRGKYSANYKEICVQRQSEVAIKPDALKVKPIALTDINSVVIISYNNQNSRYKFFFFNRHTSYNYSMDFINENLYAILRDDKLFFFSQNYVKIINFHSDHVTFKVIELPEKKHVLALSSEMLLYSIDHNGVSTLHYDTLEENEDPFSVKLVGDEVFLNSPLSSQVYVFSYRKINYLLFADNEFFQLFYISKSKELISLEKFTLKDLFPLEKKFSFEMFYFNRSTKQIFLMYRIDHGENSIRYILIMNIRSRTFVSVLQMEMAFVTKFQSYQICPSRDGTQLFIPQTYDNKVIFYHVFTLLPSELHLEHIAALFIRKNFTESEIISANIPRHLKDDLLG